MPGAEPVDLTVVMTAHREGLLAHHTLRALRAGAERAVAEGVSVRVQVVVDSPDAATAALMAEAVGPTGYFAGVCDADLLEVAVRDPGLARNAGVAASESRHVAVLDADNLPTAGWLVGGVRALDEVGRAAVVHPAQLITFGERSEIWPQRSSDDATFNVANLYELNSWDTVCIAHREVFERFPYAATGATGFGFEDWHWYTRTVAAGVPHVVAPATAYLYRIKPGDSVNSAHHSRGSVLPPTELLTDSALAERLVAAPHEVAVRKRVRTAQQRVVLQRWRRDERREPVVVAPRRRERWWGQWLGSPVVPAHYRLRYGDLAGMDDAQLRAHYRRLGRFEGRRPRLDDRELAALHPEVFDVDHYLLLHADLAGMDHADAVRHFLAHGRAEGRRTRLDRASLQDLRLLDVEDYRADNPDLDVLDDDQLVAHFLTFGRPEGRRGHLPSAERYRLDDTTLPARLLEEWRDLHELEPLIPIPTPARLRGYAVIGPPVDGSATPASMVWWQAVDALRGTRPRAMIFAPWLRMGGADILVGRYAQTVAELQADWEVVVVTTHAASTTQAWMPPGVQLVELPAMDGYERLTARHKRELVANLVVQLRPELVHVINSPEAYDGFEWCSPAMTAASRVHLTTFVIDRGPDGDIHNVLAKRRTGFLDDAETVIVDNHALVDQLVELYRFPRDKFHVHHQAVDLPPRVPPRRREPGDPVRVLWAARFDRQKRLDVLADVVDAAAAEGLPVEWHVFGAPVIDSPGDIEHVLARLSAAGVTLHGPYSPDNPLVYADHDAFLLTSESEGIPLTLLDVMAARLPVVAAGVGGVPELIDAGTGFPVADHEDVAGYLDQLRTLVARPEEGWNRAEAGYRRLESEYSWEAFKERTRATPGYLTPRFASPVQQVAVGAER